MHEIYRSDVTKAFQRESHFNMSCGEFMKNVWLLVPFLVLSVSAKEINFSRDIRPILSDNCFHCHGPDGGEHGELWKGGLRLDSEEGAKADLSTVKLQVKNAKRQVEGKELSTKKSKAKFAIVSGSPEKSSLISRIYTDDEDDVMPPKDSNHSLSDAEKKLLKDWISQGAKWGKHWSYEAPVKAKLPAVKNKDWLKNEVDNFVLRQLEMKNISPAPEADKTTWLRRVSLDLTGLPPRPEEVDDFLNDNSAGSYEKVANRLLASQAYAERMALEWMDAARYADTSGYQYDSPRSMWPWRDWVINAFHKNVGYDQFVTEQLAGDLLPNATLQQKIATGFNRNHGFTIEGGTIDEEYRVQYVNDRVNTFGTVFLGLTMDCTRCHNHKYDPLTAKDYYSISAFFDKINERGRVGGRPQASAPLVNLPLYNEQNVKNLEQNLSAILKAPLSPENTAKYEKWYDEFYAQKSSLNIVSAESSGGATVEKQLDYSFKFSGKISDEDTYTFIADTSSGQFNSLALEVLPDASMVNNGPGRADNGNGVPNFITLQIGSKGDPKSFKQVRLQEAYADHTQKGFSVGDILKNNTNGWAIEGNVKHDKRFAVVGIKKTLKTKEGQQLRIRLNFKSPHAKHSFGRVRLNLFKSKAKESFATLKMKEDFKKGKIKENRLQEYYLKSFDKKVKGLVSKLATEKKNIVQVMVMEEKPAIRKTHLLERGEYDKKGEVVVAQAPGFLPKFKDEYPPNRLGLSQWLTDKSNPLFARVTVNRYWQMLFGMGLVKTTEDFGSQGEKPSHPELLDWLAVDFRESGWDMHALLKKMVLSATYRQSSKIRQTVEDPENRLLARGARFRLAAEIIRDQALYTAGILSDKTGGPSVFPYQPAGLWMELSNRPGYRMVYKQSSGDSLYRKSMYTFWKRALPNPSMSAFDAPERDVCIVKRAQTNTPLQALTLLHDPTYVEAARVLAAKNLQTHKDINSAIVGAFRTVLSRKPLADEIQILKDLYTQKLAILTKRPELISSQLSVGEFNNADELDQKSLAAFSSVCHTLFNLSETITRN